jgi:hypothetical protein
MPNQIFNRQLNGLTAEITLHKQMYCKNRKIQKIMSKHRRNYFKEFQLKDPEHKLEMDCPRLEKL